MKKERGEAEGAPLADGSGEAGGRMKMGVTKTM
jgi:hypothetical protein